MALRFAQIMAARFQLDGERVRVKDSNTNFVLEYYSYLARGRRSRQQRNSAGEPGASHVLSGNLSLCHDSARDRRNAIYRAVIAKHQRRGFRHQN